MNFKKIIAATAAITIVSPAAINVSACSSNSISNQKIGLSTITQLTGIYIGLNFNNIQKYSDLNTLLNTSEQFSLHPLSFGYTVNWYSDSSLSQKINTFPQKVGQVFLQIQASSTDPYWTGTSNILSLNIKGDLSSLDNSSPLYLSYDSTKSISDWDSFILQDKNYFSQSLSSEDTITWYQSGNKISNPEAVKQSNATNLSFTVATNGNSAKDSNDPFWYGTSRKISVNVQKISVSFLDSYLENLTINANLNQSYSSDNNIKNIVANLPKTIADSYSSLQSFSINWFYDAQGKKPINSTTKEKIGQQVYFQVNVFSTDPNWAGSSSFIPLSLAKQDLSKVKNLDNISYIFNSKNDLSSLDSYIQSADPFNGSKGGFPLGAGYNINWYSNATDQKNNVNQINDSLQSSFSGQIVYLTIIPTTTDPNWVNEAQLSLLINKNDITKLSIPSENQKSPLKFSVDKKSTFSALDNQIIKAIIPSQYPLITPDEVSSFKANIDFYVNNGGKVPSKINDNNQTTGSFYVNISFSPSEPNWMGGIKVYIELN